MSPDATALVGIQWVNLRLSPFGEAVGAEMSPSGSLGFPDLPCLKDARQLVISAPGLLAIAEGAFPAATLREHAAHAGLKAATYRGVELWISPDGSALGIARISDPLLLIGARKTIEAAIDRTSTASSRRSSPLLAPAARFAARDLWVVAARLPDPLASLFVPLDAEALAFEGGVSLRSGLQIDATLNAGSPQAALAVAEKLRRSLSTLPAVAQGLQITPDAGNVVLSLEVNSSQLVSNLRRAAPATTAVTIAEPAAPAGPQIIRIIGLEEGPREIVLPPARVSAIH